MKKPLRQRSGRGNTDKETPAPLPERVPNQLLRRNRSKLLGELCFLVRGVVLMQNALACCGIDRRNGFGIERVCRLFVAGLDCRKELFDTRLERGLDHFVLFRLLLGNQHALLRRFDIGHDITPSKWLLS